MAFALILAMAPRLQALADSAGDRENLARIQGFQYDTAALEGLEPEFLAADADRVTKAGGTLRIRLSAGAESGVVALEDSAGAGHYVYLGRYPSLHVSILYVAREEAGEFLLIAEPGGAAIRVNGVPVFSPSGRRFAVSDAGLAYGRGDVEIWRIGADGFEREYAGPPAGEGGMFDDLRWDGEDRLDLGESPDNAMGLGHAPRSSALLFLNGTWVWRRR